MNLFIRKAIMLFIVLMGVALINYPAMATDVGGIIDTDTTWDLAGSPYNITSDVQIAEGVTLTIESGVIVNGNNKWIEVWGALEAVGLQDDYIKFDYVNIASKISNASIDIEYSYFENLFLSWSGYNYFLKNSILKNTRQLRLSPISDLYIEKNIFIRSGSIGVWQGSETAYIKNNVFNESYLSVGHINISAGGIVCEHNSFLTTDQVAVSLGSHTTGGDLIATNNFWNTTEAEIIESMIYDRNDDLNISYYVEYEPYLTEPHPDTPILDENQAPISNSGDDQAVHDQVTLNGTGSFDPDGSIVSYDWSLHHRTNSAYNRTASGDTPTIYDLNPGFYDVYLTVTDNGGLVDVDNMLLAVAGSCFCTPSTFHIEMIEPDLLKADKGERHGQALVKVMDDCGNAVSGATVYGTFSGDLSESINGQTGGDGNVLLTTTISTKGKPSFTFCVDDLINGTLSYAPADNVETCDSYQ